MPVKSHVIAVGTTPTVLNPDPDTDGVFGNNVLVAVPSSTVYVGNETVTTSTGFPVGAAGIALGLTFEVKPGDALYGVVVSGTVNANTLATGV